jgi:hypothetical protein
MRRSFISTADVVDILSIQRVLSRVGSYADQKRWEDHRQLFSDEVVIDFGGVKPSQTIGSDNPMKWNKESYKGVKTQHTFTNQDVEIMGDTATATSICATYAAASRA